MTMIRLDFERIGEIIVVCVIIKSLLRYVYYRLMYFLNTNQFGYNHYMNNKSKYKKSKYNIK